MGTTVTDKKETVAVKNKVKRIALVGNPNSGKTTLYNSLTGTVQYVGNWPGVTVEKKEGKLKGYDDIILTDLPGIYSLSPYTLEEVITRDYLIDAPDAIINIVDATNLERNLYLTMQLSELGIPVVVALNMIDLVEKKGDSINIDKLEKYTGCKVMPMSALKGTGIKEVIAEAAKLAESSEHADSTCILSQDIEASLSEIAEMIEGLVPDKLLRWYTIKLFERDSKVLAELKLDSNKMNHLKRIISLSEKAHDDDSESIITNERYNFIVNFINECMTKERSTKDSVSANIDKIVTNRILALPIFVGVMVLIYYIAMSSVGAFGTDWVNESLFGEIIPDALGGFLESVGAAEWLTALILDGIVAGVGSVLGFLPQLAVLFLLLAILEDVGYMARIAFILDKIFRKFGLSGKSMIPILIGTGCSIPGIMASRTIENENDRKMTIMTTSFMPCGAKLPIIALIAGSLFDESFIVTISAYFIGVAAILISGIILKKFKAFASNPSPFVMELPEYHVPSIKNILLHTWDKVKSFVVKAGTIIFLACVVIWFLSNFSFRFEMVDADESILATVGRVIAPIFAPLGWGNWESAVATITGLIAKENVVGTFGVLLGHVEEVSEEGIEIWGALSILFTQLSAYSFLLFNLLCAPCFAAIGAIRREMGNAKWTWIAIGYQTALAYAVSLCTYQFGMLISGSFGAFTVLAFLVLALVIYLLVRPAAKSSAKIDKKAIAVT